MSKIVRISIAVSLLLACLFLPSNTNNFAAPAAAQSRTRAASRYAARLLAFEDFVRRQMKSDRTVGMTVGFFKDDYTWVKAFGYADLENQIPTKPESAYRLASITKPMTAIAVLQLAESGKISLDDEVQKYVPFFPRKKHPVTVRQLLGHLGGIPAYKTPAEQRIKERKNTREAIAIFADYDLIAEPNSTFYYSSYGYNLLGAVVESASGKSYGEYMRENVWSPLGMGGTRMDDPVDIIPNRVRGYRLVSGKVKNSEFVDVSSRFASGGTRSTVIDLLKLGRAMIDGKLLSPETRDRMWNPMTTSGGRFTVYGMGWWTDSSNGRFVVSHGGSQNETQTALIVLPKQDFAIAVAMNFESAIPYPYTERLYEIILDEPWSIDVYTKNEEDRILLRGMDAAFDYGMRHLDQYDRPLTTDTKELSEAFAYFNNILDLPPKEAEQQVSKGRHPEAGQAFVKLASFIGAKLREDKGGNKFNDYYRRGAIAIFADYVDWYRRTPAHPAELRFSEKFERRVSQWNADWNRSWNDATRKLQITEASDLRQVERLLRDSFRGASVYPNFIKNFKSLGIAYRERLEIHKALEVVQMGLTFYPDSADLNLGLAMSHVVAGDKEKALPFLKRFFELEPRYASANGINSLAYELSGRGHVEAGIRLLGIGTEMYPREANLYDSIGEFHMGMGRKEKAIEFYTKALEVNPNYPNAAKAKELLEKLRQQ